MTQISHSETQLAGLDPQQAEQELDLTGLVCPLPVLKAKVALKAMDPGQILRVHTTDPMSVVDLRVFCLRSGHELTSWQEDDGHFEFLIRRGAEPD